MNDSPGNQVELNRFGFYELKHKPSPEELKEYYADVYYQNDLGAHEHEYSEEEIRYFTNRLDQKQRLVASVLAGRPFPERRFLDIGAGEGWALRHFSREGWTCTGLDFSGFGCRIHNPEMLPCLTIGDIQAGIEDLIAAGAGFEVIQLDNVLEHVLDPLVLLEEIRELTVENGVLIVEVPNDFSRLQKHLLEHGHISREFWIAVPDHISYFNREGLTALCRQAGWIVRRLITDYPMELNLFNPATNYVEDPPVGKACHRARVAAENLFHDLSPEGTDALYQVLGELGVGRQIVAFLQPGEREMKGDSG